MPSAQIAGLFQSDKGATLLFSAALALAGGSYASPVWTTCSTDLRASASNSLFSGALSENGVSIIFRQRFLQKTSALYSHHARMIARYVA